MMANRSIIQIGSLAKNERETEAARRSLLSACLSRVRHRQIVALIENGTTAPCLLISVESNQIRNVYFKITRSEDHALSHNLVGALKY